MNASSRILVAGIGNIFLGDDAFGMHVAQALLQRPGRSGVRVADFGIRGLDLAYTLVEGWDAAILIDACQRGEAPGTLYVIEPAVEGADGPVTVEGHAMDPVQVLRLARSLGDLPRRILILGCEPTQVDPQWDFALDLSAAVRAAVEPAVGKVEAMIGELLASSTEGSYDNPCATARA